MTVVDVGLILRQCRDIDSWGLYSWARCAQVCPVPQPAQGRRSGPFAAAVAAPEAGLGSGSAGRARPPPRGVSRRCFPQGVRASRAPAQ